MGVLEQARVAIADVEQGGRRALDQEREQTVDAIMASLAETLSEPEFTGDIETALIHYMGEEALTSDDTECYIDLAHRLEARRGKPARIPVLIINATRDEMGDSYGEYTAFLKVHKDRIHFKSTLTQEEDVKMHAFTTETASVTHRSLGLVAPTLTFDGNILATNQPLPENPKVAYEFILSDSHIAEGGHGAGIPSAYTFRNHGSERLDGEPTILVGWSEIEDAFAKSLASRPANLQEALRVKEFFKATGELDAIEKQTPRLATVIEAATTFQRVVGSLATSA